MAVPGMNVLAVALQVIASQPIVYIAYVSRSTNSIGLLEDVYAIPKTIKGSIQPVPRELMETLGLDMQRNYARVFVPNSIVDIQRDVTSDKFQFSGSTYKGISLTKWISLDLWNEILVVEIPS